MTTDQHKIELLPCPFCGAHHPVMVSDSDDKRGYRHTIKCTECPCRTEHYSSNKETAIAAWNRRATAPDATSVEQEEGQEPDYSRMSEQEWLAERCKDIGKVDRIGVFSPTVKSLDKFDEAIKRAKKDVETWSAEKLASVQIEGTKSYFKKDEQ